MRAALAARDFGTAFRLMRKYDAASQDRIASAVEGLDQSRVSKIVHGRDRVASLELIERIADGLRIPGGMLGLARRTWEPTAHPPHAQADVKAPVVDSQSSTAQQPVTNPEATAQGLVYEPSVRRTLSTVAELGRADVRRRDMLLRSSFVLGALAGPSRDWLLTSLDAADSGRPAHADMAAVESIRNMFGVFQEMDVIQGGGDIARRTVAQYLTEHVLPLLQESHPEPVRQALFEVAAEQTYLAGWMAFDSGQHGIAQRYLIQSLRLADAAGNRMLGAHVLAGLSDQATQLGHPDEGLRLARAGRHGLRGLRAPAALTDLYVLEARALSVLGRSTDTAATIAQAEKTFDLINPANEPEWAKFIDEPYVTGEIANSLRDIGDPAEAHRYARQSVEAARKQNRGRRGALSQTVVAVSFTQQNDLEGAIAAGHQAIDIAAGVPTSARYVTAMTDLRKRLTPYQHNTHARELVSRIDRTALAGNAA
ncbi:helix-turn-helix domain-containing protein [Frankia sp. CiP1_Cm_nod1]|uniref:helix-turn-helix domain-containing protein n=1 Tax=Frankia sp. CiP1_Cm_nod1 TaxID=2897160 RepID=UPI0020256C69